ncbi:MAG TPA: carbon-nitrogen hydrolase family protein [Steroidobacteraceae bacterium]|nr:carbon-nitrogen hydrolase family protein [Steroidobacteraceae bacterium]
MPLAAAIQMTSSPSVAENLSAARELLEQAAARSVVLAALPENFAIMGLRETDKLSVSETYGDGPIQDWLSRTARELGIWIVGGTMPMRSDESNRVAAACLVYDAQGACVARYDKMHLFDVDIPGRAESYRESATIAPGSEPRVIDTPIGKLGLAVCYDMRFPELFRHAVAQGATVLSVPSAFTVPTGLAHWDVLLRARAIENLCYVLAPAQVGTHANGRETYGNAMIVDPWGEVLSRVEDVPGIAIAHIDAENQQAMRARFPALLHRRLHSPD